MADNPLKTALKHWPEKARKRAAFMETLMSQAEEGLPMPPTKEDQDTTGFTEISCLWAGSEGNNLLAWAKKQGIEAIEGECTEKGHWLRSVHLNLHSLDELWALSQHFDVMVRTLKDGQRFLAIDQKGKMFRQR